VLERRFFVEATAHFGRVFVTSRATVVSGDCFDRIAFQIFPEVGARQLRCSGVRLESPQAIDIRWLAAIAADGVEVVSSD
jgi:hypothetical protein